MSVTRAPKNNQKRAQQNNQEKIEANKDYLERMDGADNEIKKGNDRQQTEENTKNRETHMKTHTHRKQHKHGGTEEETQRLRQRGRETCRNRGRQQVSLEEEKERYSDR